MMDSFYRARYEVQAIKNTPGEYCGECGSLLVIKDEWTGYDVAERLYCPLCEARAELALATERVEEFCKRHNLRIPPGSLVEMLDHVMAHADHVERSSAAEFAGYLERDGLEITGVVKGFGEWGEWCTHTLDTDTVLQEFMAEHAGDTDAVSL